MAPLRWGIVGPGWHVDRFMGPGLTHAQDTVLHAICSRDQARAEAVARKFGAAKTYTSYEAMLDDPQLDVVYVCSPNFLHREHTVKAAERGKHVLCEKILALTLAECTDMIEACEKAGVRLATAFNARNHPAHREARDYVATGALGELIAADAMWASGPRGRGEMEPRTGLRDWWNHLDLAGAGALYGPGTHALDLVRFILADEAVAVTALTDAHEPERPLERSLVTSLRMRSGALVTVHASRILPDPRNDVVVYGVNARIACLNTMSTTFTGTLEIKDAAGSRSKTYGEGDQFVLQVEAFNHAVRTRGKAPATGWDGYKTQELCLAVLESARSGKTVHLGK